MPYSRNTYFNPSYRYRNAWSLTPQGRTLSVSGYNTSSMFDTLSSSIPIFYVLMFLAIAFDMYLGFSVLAKSGVNIMLIVGAILFDFFFAVAPVLAIAIFAIAGWKIYTYYSVLPPGFSIFSMVNGKIVIIFSFLCAVFHLIGSEKALAHFNFWLINKKEYNNYVRRTDVKKPEKSYLPLDFVGDFKSGVSGNTEIVVNDQGIASIGYIHIIWDDEIKDLIGLQTDQNAMRAIAIKCKENQL